MKLFIILLRYIKPIETVDLYRSKHISFLEYYYEKGALLASGPQIPRTGGIIIAQAQNESTIEKIVVQDPFIINECADYTIYEFKPTKYASNGAKFFKKYSYT